MRPAPLIIDLDATLVTAHSEKEHAAPTFKRGFGFHPLLAFVDHGQAGTGEPLHLKLRPGNAGSNTAADHITVTKKTLAQLRRHRPGTRPGRKVLIRTDAAGATHAFLDWLTERRLSYSVGFTLGEIGDVLAKIPAQVWTPAHTSDGQVRDGAWIAELTGLLDLSDWPPGMRVIARKERPHPGAQRLTDVDGHRIIAFATNTRGGQLPDLELRHHRRARAEDRIRNLKDTGLANLPLHDFDQNRIWCALVGLAGEITAWMQLLGFDQREARRWEPKRLRYRIFTIPAQLARTGRRVLLHFAAAHRGPASLPTPSPVCGHSPHPADPLNRSEPRISRLRPVEPAPTEATLAELSHPEATMTRAQPASCPSDDQKGRHERSGLGIGSHWPFESWGRFLPEHRSFHARSTSPPLPRPHHRPRQLPHETGPSERRNQDQQLLKNASRSGDFHLATSGDHELAVDTPDSQRRKRQLGTKIY
jgi:hypothetical protein